VKVVRGEEVVTLGSSTYLEGEDGEKRAIFLLGSRLFKRVACRDTSSSAVLCIGQGPPRFRPKGRYPSSQKLDQRRKDPPCEECRIYY